MVGNRRYEQQCELSVLEIWNKVTVEKQRKQKRLQANQDNMEYVM